MVPSRLARFLGRRFGCAVPCSSIMLPFLLPTVVRATIRSPRLRVLLIVEPALAGLAAEPLAPPAWEFATADGARPRRQLQPPLDHDDPLGFHRPSTIKYTVNLLNGCDGTQRSRGSA